MRNNKSLKYKKIYILLMSLVADLAYAETTVKYTTKKQINLVNLTNQNIYLDIDENSSDSNFAYTIAENGNVEQGALSSRGTFNNSTGTFNAPRLEIPADSTVSIMPGMQINFYNEGNSGDNVWVSPGSGGVVVTNNVTGSALTYNSSIANQWIGAYVDPTSSWNSNMPVDGYNVSANGANPNGPSVVKGYDASAFAGIYYDEDTALSSNHSLQYYIDKENSNILTNDYDVSYNLDNSHSQNNPFYVANQEGLANPYNVKTTGYVSSEEIAGFEDKNKGLDPFKSTTFVLTPNNYDYKPTFKGSVTGPSGGGLGAEHATLAQTNLVNNTNKPIDFYVNNGSATPAYVLPANSTLVLPAGTKYVYDSTEGGYYIQLPTTGRAYILNNQTGDKKYVGGLGLWYEVSINNSTALSGGQISWNKGQDGGVVVNTSNLISNEAVYWDPAQDRTITENQQLLNEDISGGYFYTAYNLNNSAVALYNKNPTLSASYENTVKSENAYDLKNGIDENVVGHSVDLTSTQLGHDETNLKPLKLFDGSQTFEIDPYNPNNPNGNNTIVGNNNPGTANKVTPTRSYVTKQQSNLDNNTGVAVTFKGDNGPSYTLAANETLVIPAGTTIHDYVNGNSSNVWVEFDNDGQGQPYVLNNTTGAKTYLKVQDQWYGFYINPENTWNHGQVGGDNFNVSNGSTAVAAYSVNNNLNPDINRLAAKNDETVQEEIAKLYAQNAHYLRDGAPNGVSAEAYRAILNSLQPWNARSFVLEPYNAGNPTAASRNAAYSDLLTGEYVATKQINLVNSTEQSINMDLEGTSFTLPANSVIVLPIGTGIEFYNNGGGSDKLTVTIPTTSTGAYIIDTKTSIKTPIANGTYSWNVNPTSAWKEGQTSTSEYKDYTKGFLHFTNGIFTVYDLDNTIDATAYDKLVNQYGFSPYQAQKTLEDVRFSIYGAGKAQKEIQGLPSGFSSNFFDAASQKQRRLQNYALLRKHGFTALEAASIATEGQLISNKILEDGAKEDKDLVARTSKYDEYAPMDSSTFVISNYDQVFTEGKYVRKMVLGVLFGPGTHAMRIGVSYGSNTFQQDWGDFMHVVDGLGVVAMLATGVGAIYDAFMADDIAIEATEEAVDFNPDTAAADNIGMAKSLGEDYRMKGDPKVSEMEKLQEKIGADRDDIAKQKKYWKKLTARRLGAKLPVDDTVKTRMLSRRVAKVAEIDKMLGDGVYSPADTKTLFDIRDNLMKDELTKATYNRPLEDLDRFKFRAKPVVDMKDISTPDGKAKLNDYIKKETQSLADSKIANEANEKVLEENRSKITDVRAKLKSANGRKALFSRLHELDKYPDGKLTTEEEIEKDNLRALTKAKGSIPEGALDEKLTYLKEQEKELVKQRGTLLSNQRVNALRAERLSELKKINDPSAAPSKSPDDPADAPASPEYRVGYDEPRYEIKGRVIKSRVDNAVMDERAHEEIWFFDDADALSKPIIEPQLEADGRALLSHDEPKIGLANQEAKLPLFNPSKKLDLDNPIKLSAKIQSDYSDVTSYLDAGDDDGLPMSYDEAETRLRRLIDQGKEKPRALDRLQEFDRKIKLASKLDILTKMKDGYISADDRALIDARLNEIKDSAYSPYVDNHDMLDNYVEMRKEYGYVRTLADKNTELVEEVRELRRAHVPEANLTRFRELNEQLLEKQAKSSERFTRLTVEDALGKNLEDSVVGSNLVNDVDSLDLKYKEVKLPKFDDFKYAKPDGAVFDQFFSPKDGKYITRMDYYKEFPERVRYFNKNLTDRLKPITEKDFSKLKRGDVIVKYEPTGHSEFYIIKGFEPITDSILVDKYDFTYMLRSRFEDGTTKIGDHHNELMDPMEQFSSVRMSEYENTVFAKHVEPTVIRDKGRFETSLTKKGSHYYMLKDSDLTEAQIQDAFAKVKVEPYHWFYKSCQTCINDTLELAYRMRDGIEIDVPINSDDFQEVLKYNDGEDKVASRLDALIARKNTLNNDLIYLQGIANSATDEKIVQSFTANIVKAYEELGSIEQELSTNEGYIELSRKPIGGSFLFPQADAAGTDIENVSSEYIQGYRDKVGKGAFGEAWKNPETNRVIKEYNNIIGDVGDDDFKASIRAISDPNRAARYWNEIQRANGTPEYATARVIRNDGKMYLETPFVDGRDINLGTDANLLKEFNDKMHTAKLHVMDMRGDNGKIVEIGGRDILVPVDIDIVYNKNSTSFLSSSQPPGFWSVIYE